MTLDELKSFESRLIAAGYKHITSCKSNDHDDYEYYKAFRESATDPDDKGLLKYQIFFKIWNFEQFRPGYGYSVSVCIMPESCINNVGRRDLELSVDWSTDIERVEKCAAGFYKFIKTMD